MPHNSKALRLSDEILRSVKGDAWHGPAVSEALAGVTPEQARRPPFAGSHSIWEIALHLAAWHAEILAVVRGRAYRNVPQSEQWPPLADSSPAAWDSLVQSISSTAEEIANAVVVMAEDAFERPIELRTYNLEFLLHGLAQHNAYHSGQIGLLKKVV